MKKLGILIVGVMLVTFISDLTSYAGEAKEVKAEKKQIRAVLKKLAEASKNKDIKGVMALYAEAPDTMAIGASAEMGKLIGPQEIRAAYERTFSALHKVRSFKYKVISLSLSGDVAWVAADGYGSTVEGDKTVEIRGRLTGVLKKIKGKWLFVQTHWSFPASGLPEKAGDSPEALGEKLVRQVWADLKARNLAAIKKTIAPGFQSVHQDGARDRRAQIKLIKGLDIGEYTLSDFKVTENGPDIIVTYSVSVEETIKGKRLSTKPAARLSVWQKTDSSWQWIAHANLNPLKD